MEPIVTFTFISSSQLLEQTLAEWQMEPDKDGYRGYGSGMNNTYMKRKINVRKRMDKLNNYCIEMRVIARDFIWHERCNIMI